MSVHFHPLRVAAVERDADALLLSLSLDGLDDAGRAAFQALPGQYLTLRADIGGEDLRRNYSICSGPAEPTLKVGIRHVPGGRFSGWAMNGITAGQTLQVLPPEGRFVLTPDPSARRHVLCIAAGSGITPMLAILEALLAGEPNSRATLLYGNRTLGSTMLREALAQLKNRHLGRLALHHVFSREAQDAALYNGRLDQARVSEFLTSVVPVASVDEAYVCGPAGMIDAACTALAAAGLTADKVHVERFGDGLPFPERSQAPAPGDADHARISLVIDGLAREFECRRDDPSILDAGLRSGLEMPYACKAGVCSTCRGRVLEGEVRMSRNFALTDDEVAQGAVLCCQAHPLTPSVRITLDR